MNLVCLLFNVSSWESVSGVPFHFAAGHLFVLPFSGIWSQFSHEALEVFFVKIFILLPLEYVFYAVLQLYRLHFRKEMPNSYTWLHIGKPFICCWIQVIFMSSLCNVQAQSSASIVLIFMIIWLFISFIWWMWSPLISYSHLPANRFLILSLAPCETNGASIHPAVMNISKSTSLIDVFYDVSVIFAPVCVLFSSIWFLV